MEEEQRREFTEAPSFGKSFYGETDRPDTGSEITVDDDLNIDDFEFAFTPVESKSVVMTEAPAGEIFSNGRILPVYPVFNQNLVAGGLATSEEGELTNGMGRLALEGPYCIWKQKSAPQSPIQSPPQSPDRWQKSKSTGSSAEEFRRFRIRDLVLGRSCRSDEKGKNFLILDEEKEVKRLFGCPIKIGKKAARETEKKGKNGKENGGPVKELDVVQAYRRYYGKGDAGRRRRFLPFRQDLLVGFFG